MTFSAFVVLHAAHGVTLAEYLLRVLVHLLAFAGLGAAILWGVRVVGVVRSGTRSRDETNDR